MTSHAKARTAGSTMRQAAGLGRVRIASACLLGLLVFAGSSASTASAAKPTISEQLPLEVHQTTATIRAKLNPEGKATSYHFEYGSGGTLDTRIPADHELFAGSGSEPITVSASPSGLHEGTVYHFRVVATNSDGTTVGADRRFSTLNEDGLPWSRRYELVSPVDKGPVGEAGHNLGLGGAELQYQAAASGEAIAYSMAYGAEDATYGGEVAYRSELGSDGWLNVQTAPAMLGMPQGVLKGEGTAYGRFNHWLASDLGCAFSVSALPLTSDSEGIPVLEAGGRNLYRRNSDGSHDLVPKIVPTNPNSASSALTNAYFIRGASEDCERVVFETALEYPGVPFVAGAQPGTGLYEWHEGTFGFPAMIPGPSGPELPEQAQPGADKTSYWNAVSRDGSRLFFTAPSKLGGDIGRQAIFLREDGQPTVDVSQSQTATPNDNAQGSRYQMATPDGSHVFFIGRYGLAANDSSTGATTCNVGGSFFADNDGIGCDLYRYSALTGVLTDLSASSNPEDTEGASVVGVLDASDDGSRVYFAAKGQLVPGEGQTFAENTADPTRGYNVYLWDSATLKYVVTVSQADVTGGPTEAGLLVSAPREAIAIRWAARATPDGAFLVFQSTAGITGPGGVLEAYRYSAESEAVECVSCRRDGQPSLGSGGPPLPYVEEDGGSYWQPTSTISSDGSSVFFRKLDPLAVGAIGGQMNLYEWREGQISLLVSNIPGTDPVSKRVNFRGAGEDGTNVFFRTKRALVPWDTDGRQDVYAARMGGGFAPPPSPPAPCQIDESISLIPNQIYCQGAPGSPPAVSSPASSGFSGPGNLKYKAQPRCPKGKVRRKGKCVKRVRRKGKCVKRASHGKKRKKGASRNRSAK